MKVVADKRLDGVFVVSMFQMTAQRLGQVIDDAGIEVERCGNSSALFQFFFSDDSVAGRQVKQVA